MLGIELITDERKEQLQKHGVTIAMDVRFNNHYQLSQAAALMLYVDQEELNANELEDGTFDFSHVVPNGWNVSKFNKMMNKPYRDRLIIAGALIAAEIDRL